MSKLFIKITAMIFIALFGAGYWWLHPSLNIDVNAIASIEVTAKEEHYKNIRHVESADLELIELKQWLVDNRYGWARYLVTVGVGKIYVRGEKFTMIINDTNVVINYEHKQGRYVQLIKQVNIEEFKFLLQ